MKYEKDQKYLLIIGDNEKTLRHITNFQFADEILTFVQACGTEVEENQWDSARENLIGKIHNADYENTALQVESFVRSIARDNPSVISSDIKCQWLEIAIED